MAGNDDPTSREAADALIEAFTSDPESGDGVRSVYVSSWAEMSELNSWLKHYAHDRLPDGVNYVLRTEISDADKAYVVHQLTAMCRASIKEDLTHRLGWTFND